MGEVTGGHLPPPALLEDDADDAVVVAAGYVKLTLVWLVRVNKELLGSRFFLVYFLVWLPKIGNVASAEGLPSILAGCTRFSESVDRSLLGRYTCRHVWSDHAIFFVYYLVEKYQNSFFSPLLKLTGLEPLQVTGDSIRHGNFEIVAELLDFF